MKHVFLGAAMTLAVLAGSALPAAAVSPPPVSFGVEVGLVSRDIEEEGPTLGTVVGTADSSRVTARLGLQVAPPLILFGDIGFADVAVDEFDFYHSDLELLYGGGVRVILSPASHPQGVSVYTDLTVSRLSTDDQVTICLAACDTVTPTEELAQEELAWTEYAVAVGAKGRYENLRPFGGLRVSKLDGRDHIRTILLAPGDPNYVDAKVDVRQRDPVGFFLGADILLDREERSAITVQLSGIDENAFRIGYKVAF